MGFRKYLIKRVLQAVVTLFVSYVVIYAIVRAAPGDPVTAFYGMRAGVDFDPRTIDTLRHQLGLDKPVYIHFLEWFAQVLQGNLGKSYIYNRPVGELVQRAVMWTLELEAASLAIAVLIAVPLGVIAAVKQNTKTDHVARFFGVFFWSIPWYWYGAMLILLLALYADIFPAGGAYSTTDAEALFGRGTLLDMLWHLALPAIVLGTNYAGFFSRIVRSSMLETLRQEYILTARSKGLKERIVIYKHAFRNALLPIVSVLGLSIGSMLSGAAVVETVFSWPGMGRLVVESSFFRDYPTIMGTVVVTSTVIVFTILATDLIYSLLDPRIRY